MAKEIHYKHNVVIYVPCFLINEETEYPTYRYSLADASSDEQLVASLMPDYILELRGEFDAVAKSKEK